MDVKGAFSNRFAVESPKQAGMTTAAVVNKFVCTRGYSSCLGITSRRSIVDSVRCGKRVCVPYQADSNKSSDEFFKSNVDKFDVVIIDGEHSCGQVLRDIENSLNALNDGGIILVRNCLPTSEYIASVEPHGGAWCGDVYRAVAWHFSESPFLCYTIDADYGCGIIDTACKAEKRIELPYSAPEMLSYSDFDANRSDLLRVVSTSGLSEFVAKGIHRQDYGGNRPLYVITPTGDRPVCFGWCVDYMNRQTKKPDMWLIVDDGRTDAVNDQIGRIEVPYKVIKLPPEEGNTILRNLGAAFSEVPDSACVCVVEDDDWYPPNYLESAYAKLINHDFVTISECRYYHVKYRKYTVRNVVPTHGSGWSGPAIRAMRAWIASGILKFFDARFSGYWCGTRAKHDAIPVHTVGMDMGRLGTTPQHGPPVDGKGWHWSIDKECNKLSEWTGPDAYRYMNIRRSKVYVISNVAYPEENRLSVDDDDLLVFLNNANSLDYYGTHENRVVYHRSPNKSYGEERLCVKNRYVFGAGNLSIPDGFIKNLKAAYDWDYPIEEGKVRSATTGYMVAKYMEHLYPDREIVLVNFGYAVAKSTYRCPWHNWAFEARELAKFRHVFTADVRSDSDIIVPYETNQLTPDERRVEEAFTLAGSDRMTAHAYSSVFTPQIIRLEGRKSRIAEVGGVRGSGVRAFMKLLPKASVYAVGVKRSFVVDGSKSVFGDGYDSKTWDRLPTDFDLIVDDGTHKLADMKRGIPTFLEHLKSGGVLMIEDVPSEGDVSELQKVLPGAVCHRTAKISPHEDDRVVVYVKQ